MKSLAACTIVLALAACSSSPATTTTSAGTGSSTGAKSTGTTGGSTTGKHGSTTGSAAGSSTGSPLGMKCTFNTSTGEDSCTLEGYECTGEFTNAATGTCVLPQEYGTCNQDPNMDVGCQDGGTAYGLDAGITGDLFCSPALFGSPTNPVSLCIYPCNTTTDCPGLEQSCYNQLNNGCFNNQCDQDSTGAFVGPFFNTCPVLSTGDGQCLEFGSNPNIISFCFQNGTAAVGEPCNPVLRNGAFSECTYGNFCVSTQSGDGGLCFPITVDGGTCAAGDAFIAALPNSDWAVCATDCTTSKNCDAGPVGTTCQTPTGSTTSFCLP